MGLHARLVDSDLGPNGDPAELRSRPRPVAALRHRHGAQGRLGGWLIGETRLSIEDLPPGGPGSSSRPTSRSQDAHPLAGETWMLTVPPCAHLAPVPPYMIATKLVQYQQDCQASFGEIEWEYKPASVSVGSLRR